MPLFADLDRLKAELDALRPLPPEQEQRVMQKFRLEWNYNSNAIEGNSLTLGETRSLLLHGLTAQGKPLRDHLDIRGHDEAVRGLEEIVHDKRPLTEQFIREMHQVLLGEPHYKPAQTADGQPTRKRVVPGQYKTTPNNVQTATGEMFYFASVEETPAKMTDLVDWYRRETEQPTLHPVALAAEFHYRFVRIHPFDDGNGRMSRLLMNLILLRAGYAITVIKADDRNHYLAALAQADAREPEPFLRFIIENVEASLRLMIRAAKGESVDEPSDLDKKLALLKVQLLSREDTIQKVWNLETQTQTSASLLNFWLADLASQAFRFNDLFLDTGVYLVLPTRPDSKYRDEIHERNTTPTLEAAQLFRETIFQSAQSTFSNAYFRFEWNTFRAHDDHYDLILMLDFVFKQYAMDVSYRLISSKAKESQVSNLLFSSYYKSNYNHAQIHELNHQIANKVYDFIATKVADTLPPQP